MNRLDDIVRARKGWQGTAVLTTNSFSSTTILAVNFPDAGIYTVEFSVSPPPTLPVPTGQPAPTGFFFAIATVSWIVGGNPVTRQVSVDNGVSLSGTGEGCVVVVSDVTPVVGEPPTSELYIGNPYTISVTISPGVRANTEQPARLQGVAGTASPDFPPDYQTGAFVQLLSAAAGPSPEVMYAVPRSAGVVSVFVAGFDTSTNAPAQDLEVLQLSVLGTDAGNALTLYNALSPSGWVPLFPGTAFVELLNNGDSAVYASLIWGIDG